jgi:hypothetical protein
MPFLTRWLRRLPALAGALLVASCWAQIVWNGTAGAVAPALAIHIKMPPGFVTAAPPVPDIPTLLDGDFQRAAAARIGMLAVMYRPAIRWKHQLYYTFLGMSGADNIGVGPGRQLFEWIYVREYCTRDAALTRTRASGLAERLRDLQDRLAAQGKVFVYVITPSKIGRNPELVPAGYPCPGAAVGEEKLRIWRARLDAAGVRYVDGAAILAAAKPAAPVALYPRGGSHWNALGAALVAQRLIATLDAAGARIAPFRYTVTITRAPHDQDRDIYDVMNFLWRDDRYPVPELEYTSDKPADCMPDRIAEVGGSFLFSLNDALIHTACRPDIDMYFYWDMRDFAYPGGVRSPHPVEPAVRAAEIKDAHVVVLEENEANLPGTAHTMALLDLFGVPPTVPAAAAAARPD